MTTLGKHPLFIPFIKSLIAVSLLCFGACSSQQAQETPSSDPADEVQGQASGDGLSNDLASEELSLSEDSPEKKPGADLSIQNPESPKTEPPPQENKTVEKNFTGNFSEVSVTDIKYVSKKSGGTVVVETSAPPTYHTREVPAQSQVVIEIANAQLPDRLRRPYVTKDFNQSVSSIMAYQDKGSSTVRVVVQFRSPMHAEVVREGRELRLTASEEAKEIDDSPTLGTSDDRALIGRNQETRVSGPQAQQGPIMRPGSSDSDDRDTRILPGNSAELEGENIKFYGRPISIEVRDTAVRDVINLIAEQAGVNIVLAGEVDGNITLKLRQIPWDEALLIVLKARSLGYVRQGSILRIVPLDILQRETDLARRLNDSRKSAEPLRVRVMPVGYARVADLSTQIVPFLTPVRGRVVGDNRTNSLIVTDTSDVLERVANLVKALDLPPLQVLIEGKVVEARETFARDFGIRWGFSGSPIEIGNGRSLNHNLDIALPMPIGGAGGNYQLRIGQFDIFGDLQATIGLAERQDQAKVVSSPRIVAVNNEASSIVQATNIPVQTTNTVNGVQTTTYTFVPIEMRLEVTPQVTSENDVIMQLNIKREFTTNRVAGTTPDVNRREAKTRLLVKNGQTAVVGGIYQADSNDLETGLPWLKNIPIVGWLFKSKNMSHEKTELLVFLTPRILNAETSIQKENIL